MSLSINTNIDAFDAHRNLLNTERALASSMQKLSSGLRINSAADDAAGLAVSEEMQSQISGLQQAGRNAQDGISMVQTADGALNEVTQIMHRVRDLAVQYNNGVYSTTEKAAITAEVAQLSAQVGQMVSSTSYNGITLLDSATTIATLQVGPNNGDTVAVSGVDVNSAVNSIFAAFGSVSSTGTLDIDAIDTGIDSISTGRASLGAMQNRLQDTVSFLQTNQQNTMAANSRIMDTDMASEMTNYTTLQILEQSGMAMLAQANQNPQAVLRLLSTSGS